MFFLKSSDNLVETAERVVAQINPYVPRIHGNSFVHIGCFDYVVNVSKDDPMAQVPFRDPTEPGDVSMKIGQYIADLIPEGATIQVGIGSIPDAVLRCLRNHRHLGVHSEMISDGVMELMKCGAVDNMKKNFLARRTVTSFLVGSKALYDFVDDNPGIHIDHAVTTNQPLIISRNKKVVAINSALEVDLTGQVCADSLGTKMISGIGGQLDFERGAALSEGGFPIICLASRSKRGNSTIVNTLQPGAGVTTTRYHAHWLVTEYGAVHLWGKDLVERARLMISIAHPEHREQLCKQAHERFKVPFTF